MVLAGPRRKFLGVRGDLSTGQRGHPGAATAPGAAAELLLCAEDVPQGGVRSGLGAEAAVSGASLPFAEA